MLKNALNFFIQKLNLTELNSKINIEKLSLEKIKPKLKIESIKEEILDLIFPPVCGKCGKLNKEWICEKCYKNMNRFKNVQYIKISNIKKNLKSNNKNYIKINGIHINFQKEFFYEELIYLFIYKDVIRKLIIEYKFNQKAYIANLFAIIILREEKLCRKMKEYDIIIPVPMYDEKKKQRGYNQTELIVENIFQDLEIKLEKDCLIKIKHTKVQSTLSANSRKENIKNAFWVNNIDKVKDKKIIIFDDIFTTGETVNEISRVLKNAGAKEILILVLAKD